MNYTIPRSSILAFLIPCLLPGTLRAADKREPTPSSPAAHDAQAHTADRARILSRVKWTPVADTMPNRRGGFFTKGQEYTGVPYSSVKSIGRYIGFDIGLRTFLAAVENPLSVLYTETLVGKTANAAAYYGTVCSSYTSYALRCGIPEVSRRHGPSVSKGVELVTPQSAQAAQTGDVIYTPHATESSGSHVEMVTGVTKDAQGHVVSVMVEESAPPTTRTTSRTAADFEKHLATRNKQLFRVTDPDAWRGANRAESLRFPNYEADAATPTINRTLLLDLGDWAPYEKGQPVKINVMDRDALGVKTLVIRRGGAVVEEIPLKGTGVVERTFTTCGDYSAHVVRPDGSSSPACEFAVCALDLQLPAGSKPLSDELKIGFVSENMDVIAIFLHNQSDSYGRHSLFVSEEARRAASFTVPAGLLKKPGTVEVWLIGESKFGRLKARKDIVLTGQPKVTTSLK